MSAPDTLPGLGDQGTEDWPAVTMPGAAAVDDTPAGGGTASPPAGETAGQTPARRGLPSDPIGKPLPGHARKPPAGSGPATSAPGAPVAHDVCKAKRCGIKIRWAKTDTGDSIPVDYAPDPQGNLVRYMRAPGDWRVRVVKAGEVLDESLTRWTSHFATCPEATRFRRRDQPRPAAAASSAPAAPVLEVAPAPAGPGVLLVVDGPSVAHRAFHAYGPRDDSNPGMRHPDGRPWWAVFGFLKLLVGLVERVGPDAVLVGFDDREACARRERYPDYKAGRPERSEDLHAQLDLLPDLLAELGVATMTPPALEADDVLASAASSATAAGWRVVLATSDKDAFGLITDAATVLWLRDGLDNAVTMTPAALLERRGVTPAQYRDYAALVGDKSDNLPGVDGIGEKRAVKLLTECGTLDAALADPAAAVKALGKAFGAKLTSDAGRAVIARNRDIMAEVNYLPFTPEAGRPHLAGGAIARVLKAWHLPSLIDRAVAVLARPDITGARLVPVPAAAASSPATPGAIMRGLAAPSLEQAGAEQAEADRTCVSCQTVCAARVPVLGEAGETVLLVAEHLLGDVVMVRVGAEWVAERVSGWSGLRDNRRRVHRCVTYAGWCVTPGHGDRPAHMYPGGWFCDGCAARRGIKPPTWRSYVSRGQAPAPDDPDDQDGRPVNHRRPRWRPETLDNFAWPGQGKRTAAGRRRRAEAAARAAELAEDHDAGAAVLAWLAEHHRQLLAAAAELVDQRDDLVAAAGDQAGELAGAIDLAGEHMRGAPSRSLAAGVAYALAIVAGLPGGLAARELGGFRVLRDGYEQVRPRVQLRQESGNET